MENIQETIKEIKTRLRLSMNGAASKSMREKGLTYSMNFGVELPRIKQIAESYAQESALAASLWKENVRECKIMASLLQPTDNFGQDMAEVWIEQTETYEIAQHTCLNLFSQTPYALPAAFEWIARNDGYFAYCGYMVLARLLSQKSMLSERYEEEFLDQVTAAVQDNDAQLRQAAFTALCRYAMQSTENADRAAGQMRRLLHPEQEETKAMIDEITLIKNETRL